MSAFIRARRAWCGLVTRDAGAHGADVKTALFICVHNAGRSQMAEAIFNAQAPAGLRAVSAGTRPAEVVNRAVVQALAEIGLDVSEHRPRLLTPEIAAGLIVSW